MHTKESLINDLKKTDIVSNGSLLIHSSMKAIGDVEGGGETVIDAFMAYMRDGMLIFPTHSWSDKSLKDGIYDPKTELSCVGILSNLFLKREGVVRSMHPTHSVAAYGKGASTFICRDDAVYTPCPRFGCFGGLYDLDAQILFLGTSLSKNTYVHSLEEEMKVPNRLNPNYRQIKIIETDGHMREIKFQGHYATFGDVSENYDKLLEPMLKKGITKVYKIGDAVSYLVSVREMRNWVITLLKDNPNLFENADAI